MSEDVRVLVTILILPLPYPVQNRPVAVSKEGCPTGAMSEKSTAAGAVPRVGGDAAAGVFAAMTIVVGVIALAFYYVEWPRTPYLWLGFLGLALGVLVAGIVLVEPSGYHPRTLRVVTFLFVLGMLLFLLNTGLVVMHTIGSI